MRGVIFWAACLPLCCGCVMIDVGVTNPVAGLTTVAVAPFFNLSQERAVDGQRFAMAYYTELQKIPGFQVIPVGVVEQTMFDNHLEMNNPDDVLRLTQLLNADAVVVGAVTDYSPYYPPRIGLQVSWYSPKAWTFHPGIPTDEFAREFAQPQRFKMFKHQKFHSESCPPGTLPAGASPIGPARPSPVIAPRGQSPDDEMEDSFFEGDEDDTAQIQTDIQPVLQPEMLESIDELPPVPQPQVAVQPQFSPGVPSQIPLEELLSPEAETPSNVPVPILEFSPPAPSEPEVTLTPDFDPRQPLMSYTRMFDGTDPKLTARLRDYVELTGDLRAGGWQSHLYRSEDFIRFSAHVMIVEMLQLHGGEARKRVVFKLRKYR